MRRTCLFAYEWPSGKHGTRLAIHSSKVHRRISLIRHSHLLLLSPIQLPRRARGRLIMQPPPIGGGTVARGPSVPHQKPLHSISYIPLTPYTTPFLHSCALRIHPTIQVYVVGLIEMGSSGDDSLEITPTSRPSPLSFQPGPWLGERKGP